MECTVKNIAQTYIFSYFLIFTRFFCALEGFHFSIGTCEMRDYKRLFTGQLTVQFWSLRNRSQRLAAARRKSIFIVIFVRPDSLTIAPQRAAPFAFEFLWKSAASLSAPKPIIFSETQLSILIKLLLHKPTGEQVNSLARGKSSRFRPSARVEA